MFSSEFTNANKQGAPQQSGPKKKKKKKRNNIEQNDP
jgi:hypothetical protein